MQVRRGLMWGWEPKHGIVFTVVLLLVVAVIVGALVSFAVQAAEEAAPGTSGGLDLNGSLMNVLIPVLWASIGPLVISWITKAVNAVSGRFIPRQVQVVLSSVLGAIGAGLADGGATIAATAATGAASQVYAGVQPETLRASAAPPAQPPR